MKAIIVDGHANHQPRKQRQGYIREHWPAYVFGYGGGTAATLAIIWMGVSQGWYSFVIIAFALLAMLAYFFLASLWAAGFAYDIKLLRDTLFVLGKLQPTDNLVHICLGRRHIPPDSAGA